MDFSVYDDDNDDDNGDTNRALHAPESHVPKPLWQVELESDDEDCSVHDKSCPREAHPSNDNLISAASLFSNDKISPEFLKYGGESTFVIDSTAVK